MEKYMVVCTFKKGIEMSDVYAVVAEEQAKAAELQAAQADADGEEVLRRVEPAMQQVQQHGRSRQQGNQRGLVAGPGLQRSGQRPAAQHAVHEHGHGPRLQEIRADARQHEPENADQTCPLRLEESEGAEERGHGWRVG